MSSDTVISYPIPPYSNPPINPQYYQPSRFVISAITRGVTTTVTTSENHNYVVGQQVRFIIPPAYGIRQLNEQYGYVISVPSTTQVEVDISSVGMDAFTDPGTGTVAQILAIGDINSGPINSNGRIDNITYIYGSFIDISPN